MRALGTMASGIAHDLNNGPLDKLITILWPFDRTRERL
jgi:hypothetical protein